MNAWNYLDAQITYSMMDRMKKEDAYADMWTGTVGVNNVYAQAEAQGIPRHDVALDFASGTWINLQDQKPLFLQEGPGFKSKYDKNREATYNRICKFNEDNRKNKI